MRRSIDDEPATAPPPTLDGDAPAIGWAVAVSDDYDDGDPRVVVTLEPLGEPGTGLVAHLAPPSANRLRTALRDALREIGVPASD